MPDTNRPSELILIRHAESARNKAKQGSIYFTDDEARRDVQGIPDQTIPITEFGHDQAVKTSKALFAGFRAPHYLYHSGYARTAQTAEGILAAWPANEREDIKVRHNSFVRERDPGYTYDMTAEEVARHFPWFDEYWKTTGGFLARPVGGESLSDVADRVYTFLNMLFRDRAGQRIWVVTHGGTLRAFRYLLERWTYQQALRWKEGETPENCGVTVYRFDPVKTRLVLDEYNRVYWR